MKKIVLLAIFALFISASSYGQKTTIAKFEGQDIRGVIIGGAFDVRLSQGDETGVKVEIAAESSNKLTIELTQEGYVRLGYGSDVGKYFTSAKNRPVAYIVVKELNYLNLSGSCNLICKEQFTSEKPFVMSVAGSAFCDYLDIQCKDANVSISGASKIDNFKITDSGKLTLDATVSANVSLSGSAVTSRLSVSGTSSLDALKFMCPEIQASATGTSLIKANVTGTADVTVGGLSSFKYIGSGRISGSGAKPL